MGHTMRNVLVRAACAAVLGMPVALSAAATEVREADFGGFSGDWAHPSALADDVTAISGTTGGNLYDIFRLAVPAAGGSLALTFGAGGRMEDSYSAGTTVNYSYAPFPWGWAGETLGTVQIARWNEGNKSLSLVLDPARGDTLYLALYNTHGVMDYTVTGFGRAAPGGAIQPDAPAPVPLPAAALLLGTALGGMGLAAVARRPRRRPAPPPAPGALRILDLAPVRSKTAASPVPFRRGPPQGVPRCPIPSPSSAPPAIPGRSSSG